MPTARTSTARTSTARTLSDARTSFALGIEPAVPADTRPKRKAAAAPGALVEPALVNSSRPGQRGPGTGCAAVPQPALKPPRAQPALKLPRAQPALKVRACARTSLSRARTCPCGRRGHTKTEPTERDRLEELLACRETLPPPGVDEASWLKQIALKKTWQNETIKAMQARCSTLELELAVALAENSAKDAEIVQLRQQALPPPPDPALPSIPPNPSLNPLRLDLCSPLVAVRQAPGRVHGGVRAHRVVHQVNPCSSAGVTCD